MKTGYSKPAALIGVALCLALTSFANSNALTPGKAKASLVKLKSNSSKRVSHKLDLKDISLKNVYFDFNKNSIRSSSYPELDRVAKLLTDNNGSIQLSGHADNKGAYVYNWHLSKRRSDAVKDYLVKKGADEGRIASVEFGDTKPIASNRTKAGRQKNRRVEMNFL